MEDSKVAFTYTDPARVIKFTFLKPPVATLPTPQSWAPKACEAEDVTIIRHGVKEAFELNDIPIKTLNGKTFAGNWDITPPPLDFQVTVLAQPASNEITDGQFVEELKVGTVLGQTGRANG